MQSKWQTVLPFRGGPSMWMEHFCQCWFPLSHGLLSRQGGTSSYHVSSLCKSCDSIHTHTHTTHTTHTHTHTHIYIHTQHTHAWHAYIYTCTHTHTHTHMRVYLYTYTHIHTQHTHAHTCTHTHTCTSKHTLTHTHISLLCSLPRGHLPASSASEQAENLNAIFDALNYLSSCPWKVNTRVGESAVCWVFSRLDLVMIGQSVIIFLTTKSV